MKVSSIAMAPVFIFATTLFSHCQLPCGAYNDDIQFAAMAQEAETISKACIAILQTQNEPNSLNQTIRWVNEKDACAAEICRVLTDYFLAQRIVPADPDGDKQVYQRYVLQLTLAHKIMRATLACKQCAQPGKADELKKLLQQFQHAFGNHGP